MGGVNAVSASAANLTECQSTPVPPQPVPPAAAHTPE